MIPDGFLDDLRQRTDIVELISQYVPLKKAGTNFVGLCPFHNEKSPSFSVAPDKQFYHCFGCGAHGDAAGFLVAHLGLPFPEAIKSLAERLGCAVPNDRNTTSDPAAAAAREAQRLAERAILTCLQKATDFYSAQLFRSKSAIQYLNTRRLSRDVAKKFALGFAPATWQHLGAPIFDDQENPQLIEAGLRIVNENGKSYERFRERLMFPIRDLRGAIIGFGGRAIGNGEPKYLNSPETPVFKKGHELYGLYEAKAAIRREQCVVVVEGYIDVVALSQAGLEHVVATLGTATTSQHIERLLRMTRHIIFAFDGDVAGRQAAWRALQICLPYAGDTARFAFLCLPAEHDPDSFVQTNGVDVLQAQLSKAPLLSQCLLNAAGSFLPEIDSAEGKASYLHEIKALLNKLPASMFKQQLSPAIAKHLGLPLDKVETYLQQPVTSVTHSLAATGSPISGSPSGFGQSWAATDPYQTLQNNQPHRNIRSNTVENSSFDPNLNSQLSSQPNTNVKTASFKSQRANRSGYAKSDQQSFKNVVGMSFTAPAQLPLSLKMLRALAHRPDWAHQIDSNDIGVFSEHSDFKPISDFIRTIFERNIRDSAQGLELAAQMFHSDKYMIILQQPLLPFSSAEAEKEFSDACKAGLSICLEAAQRQLLTVLKTSGSPPGDELKQRLRYLTDRLSSLKSSAQVLN